MEFSNPQPLQGEALKALRAAALAAALSLFAACSTPVPRPAPEPQTASAPRQAGTPEKPPSVARRGGGFYLDDGPGDNPPPNLDDIPDAQPRPEALSRLANNPYSVLGQDYVPDKKLKPYRKRGVASWYGRRFHGHKTSLGDTYDMYAMTAAHPTLALPSYARVTNVANGRSVVVRVNDRGPFLASRIIDLSYTAAHRLGYADKGSTLVEVETLLPGQTMLAGTQGSDRSKATDALPKSAPIQTAARTPARASDPGAVLVASAGPVSAALVEAEDRDPIADLIAAAEASPPKPLVLPTVNESGGTFLQLGAFSSEDSAASFRDHLSRELAWLSEKIVVRPKAGMFRLHLGPYASAGDASRIAERIRRSLDIKPFVVAP
jgi:rare lipoprotein A